MTAKNSPSAMPHTGHLPRNPGAASFVAARASVIAVIVVLAIVCGGMNAVADGSNPGVKQRPKIGLVLGGGGAKGSAHVGVLKVIEELHIPIDYIAGTSMGAIIGGLYASGMTPDEIGQELINMKWSEVFDDATPRADRPLQRKLDDRDYLVKKKPGFRDGKIKLPPGIIQGQKFNLELTRLTLPVAGISNFDDLPIPFRAVATDIETGEKIVLSGGHLDRALRASMAVPGAFSPVLIDGRLLVDGGISDNVPINVARDMGADVVIVVDLSADLKTSAEITSVVSMLGQLSALLTVRNAERQIATLRPDDLHLEPELRDVGSGSFDKVAEGIQYGEEAARAAQDELLRFAASPRVYDAALAARDRGHYEIAPVIDFVRFVNESRLSKNVLTARLNIKVGEPLDVPALEAGIANLYGLAVFQSVRYELVTEGSQSGLVITTEEKSWGPNYLQFGLGLAVDFGDDDMWDVGLRYLKTNINSLGGEVSFAGQVGERPLALIEWYQPLDAQWRFFIRPRVFFFSRDVSQFENGDQIDEYRVRRTGASLLAGYLFGNNAELGVGIRRYIGDAKLRIGSRRMPDFSFNNAEAYVSAYYDTLDNRNFPRHGALFDGEVSDSVESLGADENFSQVTARLAIARSWGQNTIVAGAKFAETFDGDAPLQNRFPLGGFTNLSGFASDELSGEHAALLNAAFFRRIDRVKLMPRLLSIYVGGTIEYGNVFESRSDISLDPGDSMLAGSIFLGVDTILAPLYVAYGHAERGNDAVYIFLGRVF